LTTRRAPAPSEEESVGALVARLGTDLQRIVRAEMRLLQARANAAGSVLLAASGGLVLALVLGLGGVGALVAAAVLLVGIVLPPWIAALAVGATLVAIAVVVTVAKVRALKNGMRQALAPVDAEPIRVSHHGG